MNTEKQTSRRKPKKPVYDSALRQEQAQLTVNKIMAALFEVFEESESSDSITYKEVATRAGVTEMTVYRNFPKRADLMTALWKSINQRMGSHVRMPLSVDELLAVNGTLHRGFEKNAKVIVASITSEQGREMRTSINKDRQAAFLGIVKELNPDLAPKMRKHYAAILQLLHSAYAWDSLRLHWDMSGEEVADATQEALQIFIQSIKKRKSS